MLFPQRLEPALACRTRRSIPDIMHQRLQLWPGVRGHFLQEILHLAKPIPQHNGEPSSKASHPREVHP